jgi:putative transposase
MGGLCCHVLNRGNGRAEVFHDEDDYAGFVELLPLACGRTRMRILGWCLMPNHFHLVVWPRADGDLAAWMHWLMTSHVRRHHRRHGTSGHVWQGRFKSFPIQKRRPSASRRAMGVVEGEDPLWAVLRYVERNALRAKLVARAEDWAWSSLSWVCGLSPAPAWVSRSWLERPAGWVARVNAAESGEELAAVRRSVIRGRPYGSASWAKRTAALLGLEHTLRPRGRPRKDAAEK